MMPDRIETLGHSLVQHGAYSNRIYLMKLDARDMPSIIEDLDALAERAGYTKLFAKVPAEVETAFVARGYRREAMIPGFFGVTGDTSFLAKYLDPARAEAADPGTIAGIIEVARAKTPAPGRGPEVPRLPDDLTLHRCMPEHADEMADLYRIVFPSYPFPIDDATYIRETMATHVAYFGVRRNGRLIALSSAETDRTASNVEMTDFATLPECRGLSLARILLHTMERAMIDEGIRTAYTIARAASPGMNITFARLGYEFGGTLINNTQISGAIESMNIWYKPLDMARGQ